MSRPAQVGVVLFIAWLAIFVMLQSSDTADRNTVQLVGLLPLWGPLLAICVLTVLAWVEKRLRR